MEKNIDFQTIGHLCHDWSPQGNVLGGTASYTSLFAKNLGLNVSILTSIGKDFEFQDTFKNIDLKIIPSLSTTYFKNEYDGMNRQQFLLKKANNILSDHITPEIQKSKMVLLGPIANEIDFGVINKFQTSTVAICPQGWMRRWNSEGKVYHEMLNDWTVFSGADMVILSNEDINHQLELIPKLASIFKILVITKAESGAEVYQNNNKYTFPGFNANVIDPTGAGDTFAVAFLIRYYETNDIEQAAIFANCAAAFCIEQKGIKGITEKEKIMERIKKEF